MKKNYTELLPNVTAFIFDVDGVLTNGRVILMSDGALLRTMNVRDGYALQFAVKKGFHVGVITGGKDLSVKKRLEGLGVKDIHLNAQNKIERYNKFKDKHNLSDSQILYMGDDIPDFDVMSICGIATCPSNATSEIKEIADYMSPKKGGEGCVRDVIEQTLKVQDLWPVSLDDKISSNRNETPM